MKSRVNYPEFTRGEARKAVADAVKKTADLHVGSLLLALYETNGIGTKRGSEMLDNYAEWLIYFADAVHDGADEHLLRRRLEERGLLEAFRQLNKE